MFNAEAQAKAYDRPQPNHYKPKHVSLLFLLLIKFLIFVAPYWAKSVQSRHEFIKESKNTDISENKL